MEKDKEKFLLELEKGLYDRDEEEAPPYYSIYDHVKVEGPKPKKILFAKTRNGLSKIESRKDH